MTKEILEIVAGIMTLISAVLGSFGLKQHLKIKRLQEEIDYLKWDIHRETSGVNPESGRRLIKEAQKIVRIFDINALEPLHHSRELLINFTSKRGSLLQIILLDPDSDEFKERENKEEDSSGRIRAEWTATLAILEDIQLHTKGTIEFCLFREKIDRYLLIVDALDKEHLTEHSRMLINYYPEEPSARGYTGEQFMAEYVRERDRDSIHKNLHHFNECLKKAKLVSITETCNRYVGRSQ